MNKIATVRIGPLALIPELIQSFGKEPSSLFQKHGFDLSDFDNPDNMVSYLTASQLLQSCINTTRCHHFGLLLGTLATPSHLGPAGYFLANAPTVGTALETLSEMLSLHDQGGLINLSVENNEARMEYIIILNNISAADQIYDLSMVMSCKIMRMLCGSSWNAREVRFMHSKPESTQPYKVFFKAPIHFNAPQNAIVFEKHWLNAPIPGADPLLHKHLLKEASRQKAKESDSIITALQKALYQVISAQHITSAQVAKQMGLHERTLHRRLFEHQTSFKKELDKLRYAISQQRLSTRKEPLIELAIALGYNQTSSFCRAFKTWSGMTPKQWRKSHAVKSNN
jgi:AraC-like DNA-binding protein